MMGVEFGGSWTSSVVILLRFGGETAIERRCYKAWRETAMRGRLRRPERGWFNQKIGDGP